MSPKLPLYSSNQIIKALLRDGFREGTTKSGSHQSFNKLLEDGTTLTTVVIVGKREVPRGTLRHILKLAGISPQRFRKLVR